MMYCVTAPTLGGSGNITVSVRPRLTVARIKEMTARVFEVPLSSMTSDRRARDVARPRQVAMYLAADLTPKSLPTIGRLFGGRDHTTVIHAIKRVEQLIDLDADFAADVDAVRSLLGVSRPLEMLAA